MKAVYVDFIVDRLAEMSRLKAAVWQVENCIALFEEGCTIPFISRYRKERTGGLNDVEVAEIKHWSGVFEELEKRKASILATIAQQGRLDEDLRLAIEGCVSATALEDLYLPYRPKRRTRATLAREAGLEPLADRLWAAQGDQAIREAAAAALGERVSTIEDALAGARDILAERLAETAAVREALRKLFRRGRLVARAAKAAETDGDFLKYKGYADYGEWLKRIPPHRLLAVLRGQREGFLTVRLEVDPAQACERLYQDFCQGHGRPSGLAAEQLRLVVDDAFSRLLAPSIANEVIKEYKEKADAASIEVFGENLKQLLLAPPVGRKRTLAVDPGFRNGCKLACLDEYGRLLAHRIIYPHPPQNEKFKAINVLTALLEEYRIQAIAVGNGTASRETEAFLRRVPLPEGCRVFVVSEDGASIYSASEAAREEFPEEDVTVRGAVSIGRRLMDPLAELVKIDPKSLGVGQYQHDVDQKLLKEKLDRTVLLCVNSVGVDLNTASAYLLAYVSGIGPALAARIVAYRSEKGGFTSREQLREVPRLGEKTFEQCAGFLRIREGAQPLDNSAVHPECYHIVDRMARDLHVPVQELVGNKELAARIRAADYVEGDFGLPTVNDILAELAKPGRDPRQEAEEFRFSEAVRDIEDLAPGMELPGIVTNLTDFGAFVDIGLHENGLIHVSRMGGRRGTPARILKLHQHITVSVVSVDLERRRIALALVRK